MGKIRELDCVRCGEPDFAWAPHTCLPVFVFFAELRAVRVAMWSKLDPSFVCEAWSKRGGTHTRIILSKFRRLPIA